MEHHIFLDKSCTIIKGSNANTGLNPVAELNYGQSVSRVLIHFPMEQIEQINKDCQSEKKYLLSMKNCASLMILPYYRGPVDAKGNERERASSCTVVVFRVPREFDAGRGYEYTNDFSIHENKSYTENGCNWYQSDNGNPWHNEGCIDLDAEYDKYKQGEQSLIITEQHFDFGNENFEFNITPYIEGILSEKWRNYGIGISFIPQLEKTTTLIGQYLGFFTDHTNTIYHPYVKVLVDDIISDDRMDFCLGVENKLYFTLRGDGVTLDLDENPVCRIDGTEYPVSKARRGVYYAEVNLPADSYETGAILYDEWSNIKFAGKELKTMEQSFEIKDNFGNYTIGGKSAALSVIPSIEGVQDWQEIRRDETVPVDIVFRKKYSTNETISNVNGEYKIYIKDGNNRENTIFDWQSLDKLSNEFSLQINGEELIPGEYHMDVRLSNGTVFKDVWQFKITNMLRFAYL